VETGRQLDICHTNLSFFFWSFSLFLLSFFWFPLRAISVVETHNNNNNIPSDNVPKKNLTMLFKNSFSLLLDNRSFLEWNDKHIFGLRYKMSLKIIDRFAVIVTNSLILYLKTTNWNMYNLHYVKIALSQSSFLHFEKVLFTFFNRLPKNREDTFETNCKLRHLHQILYEIGLKFDAI
jgi:hypothetical protein